MIQEAKTYDQGIADGMGIASGMLDLTAQEIRLAAGEMTAEEMRIVKAILAWRKTAIRQRAGLGD